MKSDDSRLTQHQLTNVQRHADRLLREAGAYGRFPTPVDDLLAAVERAEKSVKSGQAKNAQANSGKRTPDLKDESEGKLRAQKVPGAVWSEPG